VRSHLVLLTTLGALAIVGCSSANEPASSPVAEDADTVAVAAGEGALAGVRFDVRRDPG
jgi:hypothetical protein